MVHMTVNTVNLYSSDSEAKEKGSPFFCTIANVLSSRHRILDELAAPICDTYDHASCEDLNTMKLRYPSRRRCHHRRLYASITQGLFLLLLMALTNGTFGMNE
jgi:hypothetical protein